MVLIIIGFPLIKLYLYSLSIRYYDKLKHSNSWASRTFGTFVEDLPLKNISRSTFTVVLFRDSVNNLVLTGALILVPNKPWLQLFMINFLIEIDGIFIFGSRPYGPRSEKQAQVQNVILTTMVFNYSMLCLTDFV